jgi:putative acetyltransferase
VNIARLDPADPRARALLDQSDAYMATLYPPQSNHMEGVEALQQANVLFVGASLGAALAGCGAVKTLRDDGLYGEIKRVFVAPPFRGRGISRAIMEFLERHLAVQGVPLARLEMGALQPEAMALYRALGYLERPPFGKYQPDPQSLFMEKRL